MPKDTGKKGNFIERILLSERFMGFVSLFVVISSVVSMTFCLREGDNFVAFGLMAKAVTAGCMYLAFRFFKWDVTKGLMGGALFSLMFLEAYVVLVRLSTQQDFDVYLTAGVEGSLFLAGAGMNFLMTVIITINHFFISYASHGNPKNVVLNRIALIFKFGVYFLLVFANGRLDFSDAMRWNNHLQYVTDRALLILLLCLETQFDSFNAIRQDLRVQKREGRKSK